MAEVLKSFKLETEVINKSKELIELLEIGAKSLNMEFKLMEEFDGEILEFSLNGIHFSVCFNIQQEVATGASKLVYALYVWETVHRWHDMPPEEIDTLLTDNLNYLSDCVKEAFQAVFDYHMYHLVNGYYESKEASNQESVMEDYS